MIPAVAWFSCLGEGVDLNALLIQRNRVVAQKKEYFEFCGLQQACLGATTSAMYQDSHRTTVDTKISQPEVAQRARLAAGQRRRGMLGLRLDPDTAPCPLVSRYPLTGPRRGAAATARINTSASASTAPGTSVQMLGMPPSATDAIQATTARSPMR